MTLGAHPHPEIELGPQHGRSPRLILASNRGPVEHYVDEDGVIDRRGSAGGVATALGSLPMDCAVTWVANAANDAERLFSRRGTVCSLDGKKCLRHVAPPGDALDLYYSMFANPVLWFLQHDMWDRLQRSFTEEDLLYGWEHGYVAVNQTFAEAIVEEIDRDASPGLVMLHDYHLYAAPLFIRNLRPSATLQHFVHIPWPGADTWRHLPRSVVESICRGLLACDSVAFQTSGFAENFLMTCQTYLPGVTIDSDNVVEHEGRRTRVWNNAVSVDIWSLRSQLATPQAQAYRANLSARAAERTIVRVDRVDPSKNIVAGFRAYASLLERHPEWRERVRFLAFLVPSRDTIPEYQAYTEEVLATIGDINSRFGTPAWTPIEPFLEHNRLQALVGLSIYDVLLVNSLVDGMNLVSKEGPVLNERDGVLVLSTRAGSFEEFRGAALGVDPSDVEATGQMLHTALSMPARERRERAQRLRAAVVRNDLGHWIRMLVDDLGEHKRATNGPLSIERPAGYSQNAIAPPAARL
jgi:trehalose 6-phosphate synthase